MNIWIGFISSFVMILKHFLCMVWHLSGEYFPKVYDDMVSVWEDQSIAFDALGNDYFAGDNANVSVTSEVRWYLPWE